MQNKENNYTESEKLAYNTAIMHILNEFIQFKSSQVIVDFKDNPLNDTLAKHNKALNAEQEIESFRQRANSYFLK